MANVNQYLSQSDYLSSLSSSGDSGYGQQVEQIKEYLVDARPQSFDACIVWARLKFEENYVNMIKQLLFNLPHDAKTTTGQPFWSGPKRAPSPLVFDPHNELHMAYIVATANLHAFNYGLNGSTDVGHIAQVASQVQVPEFVPKEAKVQINDSDPAPGQSTNCLLYTSPSPRDLSTSRMPSSA